MRAEPGTPSGSERGPGPARRFLRFRIWIYALILVAVVLYRFVPGFRSHLPSLGNPVSPTRQVVIAGLDLAPVLIPRLVTEYHTLYPNLDLRTKGGGCRQALEDLVNHKADLAFLNRLPTPAEKKVISTVVDSVETYPIALGGIAVLSAVNGGIDSVSISDLSAWVRGEPGTGTNRPSHVYLPDPNLGLWDALSLQLGVRESDKPDVVWLADETMVAQAVAADPRSIGFASTLSLAPDLEKRDVRYVEVRGSTGEFAALPGPAEISRGDYPLYHYLYLAFLPQVSAAASGLVTFLYSPRGQRLVEREGFLPARETARVVQIVQKPLG